MTLWLIISLAAAATLAFKIAGYLVPTSLLERPTPARVSDLLTVALLSALVMVQTVSTGQELALDARVPAVLVAAALLSIRAPFLVVVLAAAGVAAAVRAVT